MLINIIFAFNKKHGTCKPVITIKSLKDNTYCNEVEIEGSSKVILQT